MSGLPLGESWLHFVSKMRPKVQTLGDKPGHVMLSCIQLLVLRLRLNEVKLATLKSNR